MAFEEGRSAAGGDDGEAKLDKDLRGFDQLRGLVVVLDREEDLAAFGQVHARAKLGLQEGAREGAVPTHNLAGRAHFRAQQRVDAGEAGEGQDGLFHAEPRHVGVHQCHLVGDLLRLVAFLIRGAFGEVRQGLTRHQARGDRGDG